MEELVHAALYSPVEPAPPPQEEEAVLYDPRTDSVNLGSDQLDMKQGYPSEVESTDAEGVVEDDTVLLKSNGNGVRRCCSCFHFYRSVDPDKTITPFAVVLLAVLFAVYILNQADRLVLPVAIPAGLRCEVSVKNECRNLTHSDSQDVSFTSYLTDLDLDDNMTNSTNHTDCIHFNDYEQGLLTGKCSLPLLVWGALDLLFCRCLASIQDLTKLPNSYPVTVWG